MILGYDLYPVRRQRVLRAECHFGGSLSSNNAYSGDSGVRPDLVENATE